VLVKCETCDREISWEADPCPWCGAPKAGQKAWDYEQRRRREEEEDAKRRAPLLAAFKAKKEGEEKRRNRRQMSVFFVLATVVTIVVYRVFNNPLLAVVVGYFGTAFALELLGAMR
jgi:hypothetical protein